MIRLLLIVWFIAIPTFGQQLNFENFTTNEGLSNNSVTAIENDINGGLWIATWDGLNYYDGYKFTVFKHDIDNNNSIAGNYITKIKRDAHGAIWVLTEDFKISQYIGNKQFKNYTFNNNPTAIEVSKKGNIVVCTQNTFYEFTNGKFQKVNSSSILKKNDQTLKRRLLKEQPNVIINAVLKDQKGIIWYATRKNGLFVLNHNLEDQTKGSLTHYIKVPNSDKSFNSNEIETVHEDSFGNVWLGLKDGGISMAYSNSDKIASVNPSRFPKIPNETVRAITEDSTGNLWLGYYTKGLFYYHSKTQNYTKFKIKEAALEADWERIRSLFTASDGTVWAGTYAGIIRIKTNGDYVLYASKNNSKLPHDRNYSFYEDNKKQLWIACWGGVAKFNLTNNSFEPFKGQKQLSPYHIRNVKYAKNELIIGTENDGVKLLDLNTGKIQTITTNEGILDNSIYNVYEDPQTHYYWIATLGGISIYDKDKGLIKNITDKDGLPSQLVYGLLLNENKIWASTTKGIAFIDKNSFQVNVFCPIGGWQVSEFSEGAYYQNSKGTLFFGGINGLNYFNPKNIEYDTTKSKIKLLVDNDENYKPKVEKKFSDNQLDIELICIRFPKNDKENIHYKLEGIDKDWIALEANNTIHYANLPSGNYHFLVKEGQNSTEHLLFSLHIKKAFYQTVSFYVFLSIFIFLASIVFIYFKNKTAIIQQKKLEAKILSRTAVIENQKKDLQIVNDELDEKNKEILLQKEKLLQLHNNLKNEDFEIEKFKTFVLSEFQEPISKILKIATQLTEDKEAQHNLISQSGKLVSLISEWNYLNHIKDISSVKTAAIHLYPIVKNSIEKLKKSLQTNKVNFNCEIDTTIGWVEIDVLRFRFLLQYFFNDISKYSDIDSNLNISINSKHDFLEIQLTSNSSVLQNNWNNILHYSPYFKAVQVLLNDLKGKFINTSEGNFQVRLQIPIVIINYESKQIETISWKHFNQHEDFSLDKKTILIFTEEENFASANQIVAHQDYNLIFESAASNLTSALQQMTIDCIVFYQAAFSKELLHFLKNINLEETKINKIPMLYISEDINYGLEEQSIEFGIDTFIHLPASESFIRKKITSLMERKEVAVEENKFQQKIFDILTENEIVTTPNDKLLKSSLDIIKKELHNPSFNVEMLVDQLGISRVKCYRLFKETMKQSPSDIIMSLRLQKAEALLKTNKLNISEISFECGYNDPKYFGRSFKKYFGKSPKEFKEHFV